MSVWAVQRAEAGKAVCWRVGPLEVWACRDGHEWRVAATRGREVRAAGVAHVSTPETAEWRRWAAGGGDDAVRAAPVLPDRPLVVRPADPIQILPGREARFFVGIPVWVRIALSGPDGDERVMCEEPSVQLSNSWFGTPTEGELCYALRTRAKRVLEGLVPEGNRAVCPLLVRNRANEALTLERLCLQAPHLRLYQGARHMWTNEGTVVYKGRDALSDVSYGVTPPAYDEARERLCEPRLVAPTGLAARAIGNLKAFATI